MKGLLRSVFLVLIGTGLSEGMAAERETYAGVDIASMTISFPASRTTPEVDHTELLVRGRIGAVLFPDSFPGLSVEAHLGMGTGDGEQANFSYLNEDRVTPRNEVRGTELELESLLGIYIGAETESSISFALGVTYTLNDDMTLQAEYISLVRGDSDDGFDVSGLSFGINFVLP